MLPTQPFSDRENPPTSARLGEVAVPPPPTAARPPVGPGGALVRGGSAVLLNENAKRVDDRLLRTLKRRLPPEDIFLSRSLEEAEQHIKVILQRGYRTLMVGGGDGTFASTVRLLARQTADQPFRVPDLAVLRLGTGNAIASLVGAGPALHDVDRIASGATRRGPALRILEDPDRGDVFAFGSVGYDAQVLNDYVDVVEGTKSVIGRRVAKSLAGYVYAIATRTVFAEVERKPTRVRVVSAGPASVLDPETGEEIPLDPTATLFEGVARAALVGTTPYYGFGMKVLPHAERRQDRFHLRISTASIPYLLGHLPSIWRGDLRTERFVDFLVEDVRISLSQELPMQLSGDAAGRVQNLRVRLSRRRFPLLHMR